MATIFGSDEAVVLKFDPSGNLLWQRALSAGTSAQETAAAGISPAADGTLFVSGTVGSAIAFVIHVLARPPCVFATASRTSSTARATRTAAIGTFADATDTINDPAQAIITPNGTTKFGGLDDAALISIAP